MRRTVRLGIVTEAIRLAAKRSNAKRLRDAASRLRMEHKDVPLIVLPAYPLTGPIFAIGEDKVERFVWREAERILSGAVRWKQSTGIASIAKIGEELSAHMIVGPLLEKAGPRVYMTTIVTDGGSRVIGKYRKIGVGVREKRVGISAGKEPTIVRLEGMGLTMGLFIEDDILYPEIFRSFFLQGVDILVGFSMGQLELGGTANVESVIKSLAVARSVETGVPLLIVGGTVESEDNGAESFSTILIDPEQAEPIELSDKGKGYSVVEIDVGGDALRRQKDVDLEIIRMPWRSLELLKDRH